MHRLIAKQIAKATDAEGKVDIDKLATLVGGAYDEFDRDRRRSDRSMSLMIEEVDAVNRNLEQLVAKRRVSDQVAPGRIVPLETQPQVPERLVELVAVVFHRTSLGPPSAKNKP